MIENRRKSHVEYTEEEKLAAIDLWMEKKWAMFGKWTAKGIAASAFGYLIYFLVTNGWLHK